MRNKIIAVGIILAFVGGIGVLETATCYYTKESKVVEVCDNLLTLRDNNGEEWLYECNLNVSKGDYVVVTWFDNHTHSVYDDIITSVKIK